MKLLLLRHWPRPTRTLGALYVDGKFACYTLEDRLQPKGVKIPGETAIPAGTYLITLFDSPKFGPDTPLLNDVPNFSYVEIHAGNTEADTRGCILAADRISTVDWTLRDSRLARDRLKGVIRTAVDRGEKVTITIMDSVTNLLHQEIQAEVKG